MDHLQIKQFMRPLIPIMPYHEVVKRVADEIKKRNQSIDVNANSFPTNIAYYSWSFNTDQSLIAP